MSGLVYVGKIIELLPIPNADFIVSATVVCGEGGKWRGIVRKGDFNVNDPCIVFLPDSLLDPIKHDYMPYMKDTNWRVKMRRFRGAPSEVVITRFGSPFDTETPKDIGSDITELFEVTKYCKPVPAHLQGLSCGYFPDFIPKTDELNYQRHMDMVDNLVGKSYYITEKCDGSSTTAYMKYGELHVCSRNLELVRNVDNGYWKVALKYKLDERLPEGIALQWETCGPGIQSNPHGLKEIDGFAFSAYDFLNHCYLEMEELKSLCAKIEFPLARTLEQGYAFSKNGLEFLGEGWYSNGKQREGVVVRSIYNQENGAPISFKVINLDYKD